MAVSDTIVPWLYIPPEGLTVPELFPAVDTVNAYCFKVKVAVTLFGRVHHHAAGACSPSRRPTSR